MSVPTKFARSLALALLTVSLPIGAALANDVDDLSKAIQLDDRATVESLLAKGVNVNAKTSDGSYALNMAVIRDDVSIINLLLDKGAAVNVQNDRGDSPLHCVVRFGGSPQAADILIAAGADTSLVDQEGKTPLDYAKDKQMHWNSLVDLLQ